VCDGVVSIHRAPLQNSRSRLADDAMQRTAGVREGMLLRRDDARAACELRATCCASIV
jgi:hypothetical protein